ncbi:MAG TPA: hypothetical protein VFK59_06540 [Actinomycetota bacterium]|nr:hypothetical protein [Actinomycetota bacterium]
MTRQGWPAPDAATPLVGYREWCLRGLEDPVPELHSLFHATGWPSDGRPTAAACLRPATWLLWPRSDRRHAGVPDASCECGIHAYLRPDFASFNGVREPKVRGVVLGWGRYVLGTVGWRAEFASVAALLADDAYAPALDLLAVSQGIPLVTDLRDVRLAMIEHAA